MTNTQYSSRKDLSSLILNDAADKNKKLSILPSKAIVVFSLEIVVLYEGRKYLLLTHPQYSVSSDDNEHGRHYVEGYWACPYLHFPVGLPLYDDKMTFNQAISFLQEAYKSFTKQRIVKNFIDHFIYTNSIRKCTFLPPIFEYKISPRNRNSFRLYNIARMLPNEWDDEYIYDITDPHFLKGNFFFDLGEATAEQDETTLFHGRPLMPNIDYALRNKSTYYPDGIKKPIPTYESHWVEQCDGILISIDQRGSEAMARTLERTAFNPFGSPSVALDTYRGYLAGCFAELSRKYGAGQIFFAGDGCFVGYPARGDVNRAEFAAEKISRTVEHLTKTCKHPMFTNYPISFRVSAIAGSYRFGRISGPLSTESNFDGPELTRLARLDEGHRQSMEGEQNSTITLALDGVLASIYRPEVADRDQMQFQKTFSSKTKAGQEVELTLFRKKTQ